MSDLFEGNFEAKQVKPEFGADKQNRPVVRVKMTITSDGPYKGRQLDYTGKLDEKNIRYTKQHMVELGWAGKDVRTFESDVTKADKTVPVEVRIASWDKPDGTTSRWVTINRIGNTAAPLSALEGSKVADVNSWFAEADVSSEGAKDHGDDIPF